MHADGGGGVGSYGRSCVLLSAKRLSTDTSLMMQQH